MGILKVSFWETLTGESIFPQSPGCRFIVRHLDHFKDRNSDVRPSRHLYDQNTGQTASFDSQHGPDCPAQPDLHKCMRKKTSASTEFLEGHKSNQESLKLGLEYFNYTGFLYEDDEIKSITTKVVVQGSVGTTTLPEQQLEFCAQLGKMYGCPFGNRVSRARDRTSVTPQEMREIQLGPQDSLEDINYLLTELPNFTCTSRLPPSPALSTIKLWFFITTANCVSGITVGCVEVEITPVIANIGEPPNGYVPEPYEEEPQVRDLSSIPG
jgi:hypothetical protein